MPSTKVQLSLREDVDQRIPLMAHMSFQRNLTYGSRGNKLTMDQWSTNERMDNEQHVITYADLKLRMCIHRNKRLSSDKI